MEDEAEGPDVHLLFVHLYQVFGKDDVFLHLWGVVVHAAFELSQFLLSLVSDQLGLADHDAIVMDVEGLDVHGGEPLELILMSEVDHFLNEDVEEGEGVFLGHCVAMLVLLGDVVLQGALVGDF